MKRCLFLLLGLLAGCTGDVYLTPPGGGSGGGSGGDGPGEVVDEFPEFDGATLVVQRPLSASIHYTEDGVELDAEVLSAEGDTLDFDAIVWTSDQENGAIFEGNSGDTDLDWGIHAITATADLPNGDRLQSTFGGIRVQGRQTGIYAGNMDISVAIDFQGTPVNAQCAGGLDFMVDMAGRTLGGGGQCAVNLVVINSIDMNYNVNADIDGDNADGNVGIDLGFIDVPISFDGGFVSDGEFEAFFDGQVLTFGLDGSMKASRVSPYVDPDETAQ
jgi:hypothetical protein